MKKVIGIVVAIISLPIGVFAEDLPVAASPFSATPVSGSVSGVAANAGIAYSQLLLKNRITSLDIKDNTIVSKDVENGSLKGIDLAKHTIDSKNIKADSIGGSKIKDNAIGSDEIKNGSIKNSDIKGSAAIDGTKINPNFGDQNISTDGDINVGGGYDNYGTSIYGESGNINTGGNIVADGEILAGGGVTVYSGDLTVINGNINLNNSGYITDEIDHTIDIGEPSRVDVINLNGDINAEGTILPNQDATYDLGSDTSRWATIYADNLNFKDSLNDNGVDNSQISFGNGNDTTMNFGDDNFNDTVNIIANTDINSDSWSITNAGVANFGTAYVGGNAVVTVGDTGSVTGTMLQDATITGADLALDINIDTTGSITTADFTANNSVTLGSSSADNVTLNGDTQVANGTSFTANGNVVLGDGSDDVSVSSDSWSITAPGVASGFTGITSSGTISADTFNANGNSGISNTIVVKGSDGNDCNLTVTGGIITGTTCP
jgi:hypothetical protein